MDIHIRDGVEYTGVKVNSFSIQGELFSKKCEMVLHPSTKSTDTNNFFWSWMQQLDERCIMVFHDTKRYLVKSATPMFVFSDNKGYVTNAKIKVNEIIEITRKIKIEEFLKQ
jgi:hypothetical protein